MRIHFLQDKKIPKWKKKKVIYKLYWTEHENKVLIMSDEHFGEMNL